MSLIAFEPSGTEIARATEIVAQASKSKKKSMNNAMLQYVRSNDGAADQSSISDSRGDTRENYILKYLALQVAKTAGRLRSGSTQEFATEKTQRITPMYLFQMEKEFGKDVVKTWIDSKKLDDKWQADEVTGSTEPHMRLYQIPTSWLDKRDKKTDHLELTGDRGATKEDLANFESMPEIELGTRSSSSKGPEKTVALVAAGQNANAPTVDIKVEKKTPTEIAKERKEAFAADPQEQFSILQEYQTTLTVIREAGKSSIFSQATADQAKKTLEKVSKAMLATEKIMIDGMPESDKPIMALLASITKIENEVKLVKEWAQKQDPIPGANESKRRRKK